MNKHTLLTLLIALRDEDFSKTHRDEEETHLDADQALLDYINDSVITEVYESISKWYA